MIKFERIPVDIKQRLPRVTQALEQDPRIIFAYLFGGLAGGEPKPLSDVDIAVYLADSEHLAEVKLDIFTKLCDLFGTCEIDLVILNTAPISLAGRILQNKQHLVDKEPYLRHRYESLTLRKSFDFRKKEETLFELRYGIGG
ncbi:type VII toxin-antitoxin system MntA family adenylyltransferase antitoxin [Geotalea uraniireducens]|uniref:DNA polymerase, beta domain protein region n=1 Tax=Geotalea uraniireducens (strain Rf4) TaxID=351605 RepID=A5GCV6_GEOUR|nr:nucleotidyltransferase domain-containing protein [Geotalea uraniireducens]ABQ24588.1 DNA polymerase, beta domain protein region [Geotalea uraniireducens Rf4]